MVSEPIRIECPRCGEVFTDNHQRADCPHEYTTSFTKELARLVRERLARENAK